MAKETSANARVAIIGGGHIGCALAEGLVKSGLCASLITVSSPKIFRNSTLQKLGVRTTQDNNQAVRSARFVFLAVKPSIVSTVLEEVEKTVRNKILVSVVAGVAAAKLKKYLKETHLARIMPNMPIGIAAGVVGFFNVSLSRNEDSHLRRMLSGLGTIVPVRSEKHLDAITLISGCGPGIVAFLISMLADSAKMLGLSTQEANRIALQTFNGTLAYVAHTGMTPEELMRSVATKGGVTEAILADFTKSGLVKIFTNAINAGYIRIKKLSE